MLPALLAACSSECAGPACADAWPASRLVVAGRDELAAESAVLALPRRLEGTAADGALWEVAPLGQRLVIGMPERSSVAITRHPTGIEPLEDAVEVRWDRPADERFGAAVAVVDSDGDGLDEVWVGAPGHDGDRGAVYRFPTDAVDGDGWDLRLAGLTIADRFGERLFSCGDTDGDGADDVAIGAPLFSAPDRTAWDVDVPDVAGALFLLAPHGLTGDQPVLGNAVAWWGSAAGDGVGRAVLCDTDWTGDGLPDVLLGAPYAGPSDAGRVYLRGQGAGRTTSGPLQDGDPWTLVPGDDDAGWFGATLGRARFEQVELLVGAPGHDGGAGRVVLYGGLQPDPGIAKPVVGFDNPRGLPDHFGRSVLGTDLDGDGLDELVVGAPDWSEQRGGGEARTRYDTGRAWVWSGADRFRWSLAEDAFPTIAEIRGSQAFLRIGRSLTSADPDGDARWDLLQPVRAPDPDER